MPAARRSGRARRFRAAWCWRWPRRRRRAFDIRPCYLRTRRRCRPCYLRTGRRGGPCYLRTGRRGRASHFRTRRWRWPGNIRPVRTCRSLDVRPRRARSGNLRAAGAWSICAWTDRPRPAAIAVIRSFDRRACVAATDFRPCSAWSAGRGPRNHWPTGFIKAGKPFPCCRCCGISFYK